jgi:hypothetical protein
MEKQREQICRSLGFPGITQVHQYVVEAIRGNISALPERGLDAATLEQLGYSRQALQLSRGEPRPAADEPSSLEMVKELLARETPYGALREKRITAHHCRTAGADVSLLERLGFPMAELSHVYPIRDLKRAGHGVRELSTHFSDEQLRVAGFSAVEMRMAGRTICDLQRAGYNENLIRTAGYRPCPRFAERDVREPA